jgi:DNA-binding NtrC family response regulator
MPKPCILIVDDEREMLAVFARALELDGCETQIATSAHVAMALIEATPPDAILLDLNMPYVNGLGFLYRLRESHPHLPVAIITGLSTMDAPMRGEIRALHAELRFKPLPIAEIQALARELLAQAHRTPGDHSGGAAPAC